MGRATGATLRHSECYMESYSLLVCVVLMTYAKLCTGCARDVANFDPPCTASIRRPLQNRQTDKQTDMCVNVEKERVIIDLNHVTRNIFLYMGVRI